MSQSTHEVATMTTKTTKTTTVPGLQRPLRVVFVTFLAFEGIVIHFLTTLSVLGFRITP